MKIAIVGPGALGCLITARLHQSGCNETPILIDYKEERVETLGHAGITYSSTDERHTHNIGVSLPHAAREANIDVLIFCVKSYSLAYSLEMCAPLMQSASLALFMQNGISHLTPDLPEHVAIAFGSTTEGAFLKEAGHVYHAGHGLTHFGFAGGSSAKMKAQLDQLATIFCASGLQTEIADNIEKKIWGKLMINIAINGLTAIYDCPNGSLLDIPEATCRMRHAVAEAEAVAHAHGVQLPNPPYESAVAVCKSTATNISSMLQDIRNGRKTEIEAINGRIIALGKKYNIPCPENSRIFKEVLMLEQQRPPLRAII